MAKLDHRKSKHDSATSGVVADNAEEERTAAAANDETMDEDYPHQAVPESNAVPTVETTVSSDPNHVHTRTDADNTDVPEQDSPTSPKSGVRGWIKNRFSRGKSVGEHDATGEHEKKRRSLFRSGTAKKSQRNGSVTSLEHRTSSMRDVAMAGRGGEDDVNEADAIGTTGARDSRGVSPASSIENRRPRSSHYEEPDDSPTMIPPKPIEDPAPRSSISPNRDSRFREEISP